MHHICFLTIFVKASYVLFMNYYYFIFRFLNWSQVTKFYNLFVEKKMLCCIFYLNRKNMDLFARKLPLKNGRLLIQADKELKELIFQQ